MKLSRFPPAQIFLFELHETKWKSIFYRYRWNFVWNLCRWTWDGFVKQALKHDLNFPLSHKNVLCLSSFVRFSYGAIRSGYGQHFGPQGGQDSGFPSPRSALGYPFPAMQNSYSSYHLGGYAPPCASPPKDGKFVPPKIL